MIRLFDLACSILGLILLSPIILLLIILGYMDTGSPFFKQERVGRNKKPFYLLKFRSMNINTQSIATHLADANSITKWGSFLRKSKLDEIPQLWNVLIGDMSLVGPRPNLINQEKLIHEREKRNIYAVKPGITGIAQIQKIDMSNPILLAETDAYMINNFTFWMYLKCILMTIFGNGFGDRVKK